MEKPALEDSYEMKRSTTSPTACPIRMPLASTPPVLWLCWTRMLCSPFPDSQSMSEALRLPIKAANGATELSKAS